MHTCMLTSEKEKAYHRNLKIQVRLTMQLKQGLYAALLLLFPLSSLCKYQKRVLAITPLEGASLKTCIDNLAQNTGVRLFKIQNYLSTCHNSNGPTTCGDNLLGWENWRCIARVDIYLDLTSRVQFKSLYFPKTGKCRVLAYGPDAGGDLNGNSQCVCESLIPERRPQTHVCYWKLPQWASYSTWT
ncbi:predicted protein [Plenodomus lingam JN3]|uniref:Uncharacterized protein n=1 Tax=Leptosphaeria maculans (strain JN3 / isolate v23.1.3 / race Av1-4-5-6-7-8) TaxID=985895 RepID=E4ZH20_LEPMJ|nr:predicted protein [Plenodomus lingam JN3]CBX90590.1 predicted protein [Plenodomus lingam JN3]